MKTTAITLILAGIITTNAQAPGPLNTNPNCGVGSQLGGDNENSVFYYAPTDIDDVGIYAQSLGQCDPGSYAQVSITTSNGAQTQCGYLPLDGGVHLLSCPGLSRGSIVPGSDTIFYAFDPSTGVSYFDQFGVVHTQSTATAATPTQTVTITNSRLPIPSFSLHTHYRYTLRVGTDDFLSSRHGNRHLHHHQHGHLHLHSNHRHQPSDLSYEYHHSNANPNLHHHNHHQNIHLYLDQIHQNGSNKHQDCSLPVKDHRTLSQKAYEAFQASLAY